MIRFVTVVVGWWLFSAVATCAAGDAVPVPSAGDKCPVCGMFVARYPDWTATIVFKDRAALFFDGPKDLFTYYHNIGKYSPARKRADIAAISVKDYYSLKVIDGETAYYVMGSDVLGPMGRELVPFAKAADAVEFVKDHRGEKILRFHDVTPHVLKSLE